MVPYPMDYVYHYWSFSIFEIAYEKNGFTSRIKYRQILTNFIPIVFILLVIGAMQNWMFENWIFYKNYSLRTKSEFFQKEKRSYLTILDFLIATSDKKDIQLQLHMTLSYQYQIRIIGFSLIDFLNHSKNGMLNMMLLS